MTLHTDCMLRGAKSRRLEQESSKFLMRVRGRDPERSRARKTMSGRSEDVDVIASTLASVLSG